MLRHCALEYIAISCFKCGKEVHRAAKCKSVVMVCLNCGENGHISTQFQKPKKTQDVKASGKVFSLNNTDALKSDNLI